jgi:hypothetical protein
MTFAVRFWNTILGTELMLSTMEESKLRLLLLMTMLYTAFALIKYTQTTILNAQSILNVATAFTKPLLTKKTAQRIEYTHTIGRAIGISIEQATCKEFKIAEDSDTISIAVNEYAVGSGSSGNELVSAMASEDMYEFAQPEPALPFKLMQWGAACSHPTDMPQPQVVWETETSELFTELAKKL